VGVDDVGDVHKVVEMVVVANLEGGLALMEDFDEAWDDLSVAGAGSERRKEEREEDEMEEKGTIEKSDVGRYRMSQGQQE
jgi:hypothetical protein